ncbi:type II secretion system protein J [Pedobacter sp. L105]|uniref:PulJ/GspJ family protein n=1 Tax=Pedobacter sp. L105 TaxID=1641871 RepID=UPI00131BAFA2|nr:prepilin-type N-terminal cleavage/methylation domain-containing protein [Pedobacter sp. L105]
MKMVKLQRKVPAFTIVEVTIAMLIAGIVIAITYTAYRVVSGTYLDYTKKQDRVAVLSVVDKLLKKDFLDASQITRSVNGLQLNSVNGTVAYEFAAAYVLRRQLSLPADTFKIPVKISSFAFEHQEAAEGTTVDQLDLQTSLEGEEISLLYTKKYSAQNLFN